jgi:cholinesterase
MQLFVLLLLLLCGWPTIGSLIPQHQLLPHRPKVTLSGGSVITGVIEHEYSSIRQFLGVPYAQPPVGTLRWEAPRANRLPLSVNATTYGRTCTQFLGTTANLFTRDVLEFNIRNDNTTGEDCLTLSVWTPQHAKNLPVIVFFYGGGWYTGGQDIPYQIPTQWVQRTENLVVVVLK